MTKEDRFDAVAYAYEYGLQQLEIVKHRDKLGDAIQRHYDPRTEHAFKCIFTYAPTWEKSEENLAIIFKMWQTLFRNLPTETEQFLLSTGDEELLKKLKQVGDPESPHDIT